MTNTFNILIIVHGFKKIDNYALKKQKQKTPCRYLMGGEQRE